MKKWRCHGIVSGSKYLGEVEAETEEEAIAKAEELDSYVGLCHQCSRECEDAEITDFQVDEVKPIKRKLLKKKVK